MAAVGILRMMLKGSGRSNRKRLARGGPAGRVKESATFERLFEDFAAAVRWHAARSTGDLNMAEDVVSLTFLEAWKYRQTLPAQAESIQPWLLEIAARVIDSGTLTVHLQREVLFPERPSAVVPDLGEEMVQRLADRERLAAVRVALERLSAEQRDVITLYVEEGLKHSVVAERLGVAEGTVRARLSRGRARLQELSEQEMTRALWRRSRLPGHRSPNGFGRPIIRNPSGAQPPPAAAAGAGAP
ncbi:RNA polymerase sigma factor [Streptomyces sp. NPDC057909]|uniref:RNA polymerase sigma factor n=1 Tax=Streptomyces sp. NPDC057909 TaxID=3346277 RepID=UPI0036E451C8